MAFPTDASVVVLLGSWWDESTRAGMDAAITATPVPAGGSGAPGSATPNLTDIANYGWIKSRTWTTRPLPSGLYALPLIANDDPDLSAFGGYRITPDGETAFLVNVSVTASTMQATQEIVDAVAVASSTSTASYAVTLGQTIQVVRMTEAAVLSAPAPQPPSAFLTESQINSRIATAVAGVSGGGASTLAELTDVDSADVATGTLSALRKDPGGYTLESVAPGAVVAERQSRRARAQLAALLGETMPGTSLSAASTGSVALLSGGTVVDACDTGTNVLRPEIRYSGAKVVQAGPGFPLNWMVTASGLDSTFGGLTATAELSYTGSQIEIRMRWVNNVIIPVRVWADGVLIGTTVPPASGAPDGSEVSWLVTLPDARPRVLRFDFAGGAVFAGFRIQSGQSIAYPTRSKGPRVIMLGDSYTEGSAATGDDKTMVSLLGLIMGWVDLWRSGSGGTGYLAVPDNPAGRKTFRQRAQTDVINQNPDIVIIAGGFNDYLSGAAAVKTEAGLLFTMLATALPNAEFVVVGPWGPRTDTTWDSTQRGIRDGIKAEALARGWYFIDPAAEQWVTGTGRVGDVKGDGNADTYLSVDATHLTDAGHRRFATRMAGHLRMLTAA